MDAFLFPSLAEGFGIPLVEAMHFSAPVICASCTSLPEIGGDSAYYFSSFEAESMKCYLETAIRDFESSDLRKAKMNDRARSFSWDESAKKYLEIYRLLADNK
jgi:glycosyltransferase involved in cell wall biosynthesis